MRPQSQDSAPQELTQKNDDVLVVGGTLYSLTDADLMPLCNIVAGPHLIGYKKSISVYGDAGQTLVFQLFGQAQREMHFYATCGEFSAYDYGKKFIINQTMITHGQCDQLDIHITSGGFSSWQNISVNVLIAEVF